MGRPKTNNAPFVFGPPKVPALPAAEQKPKQSPRPSYNFAIPTFPPFAGPQGSPGPADARRSGTKLPKKTGENDKKLQDILDKMGTLKFGAGETHKNLQDLHKKMGGLQFETNLREAASKLPTTTTSPPPATQTGLIDFTKSGDKGKIACSA